MPARAFTVHEGMRVRGSDEDEIGRVTEIVRHVVRSIEQSDRSSSGVGAGSGHMEDYSPAMTMTTWVEGDRGYIVVAHGGVLGIGGSHLYVPFEAVAGVAPGDSVGLGCSGNECRRLYSRRPEGK